MREVMSRTLRERFEEKYEPIEGGCWMWTGARDGAGYSMLWRDGRTDRAHRVSYELHVGPIPAGFTIDHLCDHPWCVNPEHLRACTQRDNVLRGDSRSAHNARATHCPKGHPFDEENTYVYRNGRGRMCKTCDRASSLARYYRLKR